MQIKNQTKQTTNISQSIETGMAWKLFVFAFYVARILESLVYFDQMTKLEAQIFENGRGE